MGLKLEGLGFIGCEAIDAFLGEDLGVTCEKSSVTHPWAVARIYVVTFAGADRPSPKKNIRL